MIRRELRWWLACVLLFGLYVWIDDLRFRGGTNWDLPSIAFYGGFFLYAVVGVARLAIAGIRRLVLTRA